RLIERELRYSSLTTLNSGTISVYKALRSPDKKWVFYVEDYTKSDQNLYSSLFVRPINGTVVGNPILLKAEIPVSSDGVDIIWSPDSKFLYYEWPGPEGQTTFEISSADGKIQSSKIGTVLRNGWSADGDYLAVWSADLPDA